MIELKTEVLADKFVFLEGPRWHKGELWVSDMWAHTVFRVSASGERAEVVTVPERPSGLGFMPDGTPLIVSMANQSLYKLVAGKLELHADISEHVKGDVNDMVVDASGAAYVGNFGYDLLGGATLETAVITRIEPDGSSRVVADELEFPNGMVTDNGKTLIAAESMGQRLTAFNIDEDGGLSGARRFGPTREWMPDGICLDAEGGVWVSSFATQEFIRLDASGTPTHRVPVPGRCAVACQLGGDDGMTLYCLTYEGEIEDIGAGKAGAKIEIAAAPAAAAGSP